MPPLLLLSTEADYRDHYKRTYCRSVVATHDGIRVFFNADRFDHAFFESSLRNGVKDRALSVRSCATGPGLTSNRRKYDTR